MLGRDHPRVIGEGAVDQFRGQHHRADGEADLARRQFDADLGLGVLDQLLHFADRLARHDDAGHADGARWRRDLDAGEPVAVGRDRAQHGVAVDLGDVHEHAVEIVAGFLVRDGELRLVDQPLQVGRPMREAWRQLAGGEIGEIAFGQALQGEARAAGAQQQLAVVAGAPARPARRRAACARFRRACGPAGWCAPFMPTSAGDGLGHLEVEVGRLQLQAVAVWRCSRTLDRIGMVLRRSTTRWTWPSDLSKSRSLQRDFHVREPKGTKGRQDCLAAAHKARAETANPPFPRRRRGWKV